MHPFPPPELILMIHREELRAEMARQPHRFHEPVRRRQPLMRAIRHRIAQALIAIGLRLDPSARQLPLPRAR